MDKPLDGVLFDLCGSLGHERLLRVRVTDHIVQLYSGLPDPLCTYEAPNASFREDLRRINFGALREHEEYTERVFTSEPTAIYLKNIVHKLSGDGVL